MYTRFPVGRNDEKCRNIPGNGDLLALVLIQPFGLQIQATRSRNQQRSSHDHDLVVTGRVKNVTFRLRCNIQVAI